MKEDIEELEKLAEKMEEKKPDEIIVYEWWWKGAGPFFACKPCLDTECVGDQEDCQHLKEFGAQIRRRGWARVTVDYSQWRGLRGS